MQQDVPGYALISGGKLAGLYVREGRYYRLSGGKMFDVDTGAAAASKGAEPAADPRADAEKRVAAMKAEAAGAQEKAAPEDGAKAKAKRKTADVAVIADGLIADSSAKELFALASGLVKELKANDKKVDFEPVKGEQGKRANAEFIAKNRE